MTAAAQISIPATDLPLLQEFNALALSGTSSTMPSGWVFLETGGGGSNTSYTADNGSNATDDTYSYGSTSSSERALGQLNGSSVSTMMGVSYVNNTASTITSLLIQYTGEQWRLGAIGRTDRLDFQYSTNATAINNGTWTDYNALDFTAQVTTGSIGSLDGNAAANRIQIGSILSGLSIANGTTFWIRWNFFDATGNDDGLSIDDFALTANPDLHYTVSLSGAVLSITDSDGNGEELDVTQVGSNIRFYAAGRTYSLNSGATKALPFDNAIAGLTNIVINAGTGNDTIDVETFSTSLPSLTINGGINDDVVNINGIVSLTTNSFFNADLQNDNATPGTDAFNVAANAKIICAGTGIATIKVSSNIVLNTGSSIITANGNLLVEANQQLTPTAGDFVGIDINNALLQTTGTGTTTVKGVGGSVGTLNHGIQISGGGDIIGGTSGALTIIGTGGAASGTGNRGVSISGAGSTITSSGANVTVTGTGGGISTAFANYGVHVISSAMITAGGTGSVTISGTGGIATGGNNMGVWVGTAGTITSNGGNVSVTGNGGGGSGTGTLNYGVYVQGAGKITAGSLGIVTVIGTGGAAKGASNDGVSIWEANSIITSSGGNVNVTGNGGGDTGSPSNVGVHLQSSGTITAGGTGNVIVTGIGGASSGSNNFGIFVIDNGTSITSFEGNVTLTGSGGGTSTSANNYGIVVFGGLVSSGESGNLTMTGTGAPSSGSNNVGIRISEATGMVTTGGGNITMTGYEGGGSVAYSILVHNSAIVTTETNGGDITIIGNSMSFSANIRTDPEYSIQLYPVTNGVDINLGPAAEIIGGPLQLSDAELDFLTTGSLFIGSINGGTITLSSSITRSATTNMGLVSDEDVIINGGNLNTAGGDVLLDSGASPDAIKALQAGTDLNCGTLYPAGEIAIVITGNVADVSYTQLNLIGSINLTGIASLSISGTYNAIPGQTFTIINNDGVDPILGTFTGLAEGAVFTSFLGSNFPATISYVGGTGNDVVITVSSPNYLLITSGNQITFTDLAGNGETITVSQDGANNMMFSVPGRNYSWNGSAVTALPVSTTLAGMNMVTVNAGGGNDGITVNAFTATMPHLTLNGGIGNDLISMNGDIPFAVNANLDIDLQNDDPVPGDDRITINDGVNFNLLSFGTATLKASQSIAFGNTSSLTTVDGNITMEANQQATPTTGTFYGVVLPNNSLVEITGTGMLTVKGKGGTIGITQIGVYLFNSAILKGGTTGTHTVNGTGGLTAGDHNRGVQVQLGAIISTNGGHLMVTGQGGGTDASNHNHGIHVVQGGVISAGGFGTVTIYAYGGSSTGVRNHGIHIFNAGSTITSNGANVYVYGFSGGSGASSFNHGVFVEDNATITAGGFGIVTVQGTGGGALGERNDGVIVYRPGAIITSSGGNVNVTGQGGGSGASFSNYGVLLEIGGVINAGGMGNVNVSGAAGHTSGGSNIGVYLIGATSMITSNGGSVHVTGQGGTTEGATTNGSNNIGIEVFSGSKISAGGLGNVLVEGTGSSSGGSNNYGVYVVSAAAKISSSGGDIHIIAQGGGVGAGGSNIGFHVQSQGLITAGGMGDILIEANGGPAQGGGNHGALILHNGTSVTTVNGNIEIIASGNGVANAGSCFGIEMNDGTIHTGGTGQIILQGNGALTTGGSNSGVKITGTNGLISTADGDIFITGSPGLNANALGIHQNNGAQIHTQSGGGNITLLANSMSITSTIATLPTDTVFISSLSADTSIFLGLATDVNLGPLNLSDTELDGITTGTMMIGTNAAGSITVVNTISRTISTVVNLISHHDVIFNGGLLNTNVGNAKLDVGNFPSAVRTLQAGVDLSCDTVTFSGDLAIRINGTTPDAMYDRLNVIGVVDLTGVILKLSGTYSPMEGDSFIIVVNDGMDPVIGTFIGLNEGDTLFNFLGSPLDAVISYTGNTGNDVVIRVPVICFMPDLPIVIADADTICANTQIQLSIASGNLGSAIAWHWYANACGGVEIGTGNSIMVAPSMTTTYYVRGEGGCVMNAMCASKQIIVNAYPDATIEHSFSSSCYYDDNIFQPQAAVIPNATYQWTFGQNAIPLTATGYGPHLVHYTQTGSKTVKLVIHPNAAGAQCPDSTSISFDITACPGQITGAVRSNAGNPIASVNIKLFADQDVNGIADNMVAIRNVLTNPVGGFVMASIIPGHYVLSQTQPAGWISFDDGDLTPDGDVVVNADSLDNIIPVSIIINKVDSNNVFVERPTPGQIIGSVFNDLDGDQVPDAGEGITGVVISLFSDAMANGVADNSIVIDTAITNSSGNYSLPDVAVGHYVIVETQPLGYVSIKDQDVTNDGDLIPNTNTTNDTIPVSILPNEQDAGNFFIDAPACSHVVINDNDSGFGSLRQLMSCAQNGDTITFSPALTGQTITISSDVIECNSQLVILSTINPILTIASDVEGLFVLSPSANVKFINLKMIGGFPGSTATVFDNAGVLKLEDVLISKNPMFPLSENLLFNHLGSQLFIEGLCRFN